MEWDTQRPAGELIRCSVCDEDENTNACNSLLCAFMSYVCVCVCIFPWVLKWWLSHVNPSTQGAEAGELQAAGEAELANKLQGSLAVIVKPCLRKLRQITGLKWNTLCRCLSSTIPIINTAGKNRHFRRRMWRRTVNISFLTPSRTFLSPRKSLMIML